MEYETIAYIAIGIFAALYALYRIMGQMAVRKIVRSEYEHVLNSEEHKVKGRYE